MTSVMLPLLREAADYRMLALLFEYPDEAWRREVELLRADLDGRATFLVTRSAIAREAWNRPAGTAAMTSRIVRVPFDPRELRARVQAMLRLVQREGDRNPTSGLPGGRAIESEILGRVQAVAALISASRPGKVGSGGQ